MTIIIRYEVEKRKSSELFGGHLKRAHARGCFQSDFRAVGMSQSRFCRFNGH